MGAGPGGAAPAAALPPPVRPLPHAVPTTPPRLLKVTCVYVTRDYKPSALPEHVRATLNEVGAAATFEAAAVAAAAAAAA